MICLNDSSITQENLKIAVISSILHNRHNCSKRRERAREAEREGWWKEIKKIDKSQVTCGERRKDKGGERPHIRTFSTTSIFHGKLKFYGNIWTDLADFLSDEQLSNSAGRWDVIALGQKLQAGHHIFSEVSGMSLPKCIVQYTYVDLDLLCICFIGEQSCVTVLKSLNLLCID